MKDGICGLACVVTYPWDRLAIRGNTFFCPFRLLVAAKGLAAFNPWLHSAPGFTICYSLRNLWSRLFFTKMAAVHHHVIR
jgi:hypothetical protein